MLYQKLDFSSFFPCRGHSALPFLTLLVVLLGGTFHPASDTLAQEQTSPAITTVNETELFDLFLIEYSRQHKLPSQAEQWPMEAFDRAAVAFERWLATFYQQGTERQQQEISRMYREAGEQAYRQAQKERSTK